MDRKKRPSNSLAPVANPDLFEMSSSDEEYVPEKGEEMPVLVKTQKTENVAQSTKALFSRMQEECHQREALRREKLKEEMGMDSERKVDCSRQVLEELGKRMKQTNEGIIHFAGKLFRIKENGDMEEIDDKESKKGFEELQRLATKYTEENKDPNKKSSDKYHRIEEEEYRHILKEKKHNLKSLVSLLNNRHRNVSALFKSKIDWKRYTAMSQLDKKLEQNRKDGFIAKQQFLANSDVRQNKAT